MEGLTFWDLTASGLGTMHLYGNFMGVQKSIRSYSTEGRITAAVNPGTKSATTRKQQLGPLKAN